jgi:gliding motility-associated-like protein
MIASSMFLDIEATDNKLTLIFRKNIPWKNDQYIIYKQNKTSLEFDSLDISPTDYYTDDNLSNGTKYCYKIKSIGNYDIEGFVDPIINFSQQNCGIPIDTVPPEPPILEVNSDCDNFRNILNWTISSPVNEIIKYNIYYSQLADAQLELIASNNSGDSTTFIHNETIAGCYAVTALDSVLNESKKSNKVCVDNCTFYEFPNVFTPNGDNFNDLFVPITPTDVINKFVERVDFKVYNRWGNLVFKTTDPKINWDGKIMNSDRLVSVGVYYYVCDVYEYRITGIEPRYLIGFVHVFDSKKSGVKP